MKKDFSKFEIAAIKRTAQNVNSMVTKKTKLKEKINILQAEYNQLEEAQEQFESPIRKMTGGYSTEDLIDKIIENTDKLDKNGNSIKITKYVLKYPDTILPPIMDENVEIVDNTEDILEVEEPIEESIMGDPITESSLAPENGEYNTNPNDLPFIN